MLPNEATHSSLDLFEKQPLLITFQNAFDQKIGPVYSPNGPMLEFEITGDRNNFVDLQKIYLEIRCKVTQSNGADLRYDNTDPTVSDSPLLVNNSLYSLFSDCTLSANGLKISNANSNFAHKSFIGTQFSNSKGAKDSWLKCQGYRFENNPAAIDAADFTSQRELVLESREIWFYGPAGVDFFTCDKHLLSGVTLRFSYRRSHEDFLIISEDVAKHYKLQILEANLFVRKMTVTDHVLSAIESTLLKTPANYPYQEEITKTFLATAGQRSWQQEDIFAREPVRQIIIALNTNNAFLGTNRTNPFQYQKFGLEQVTLRRNGLPIASTPISTQDHKRLFFDTLSALGLLHCGLGITLDNYQQHFIMCFDLTSTQQAAHDFLHPELTSCSVSLDLQFSIDFYQSKKKNTKSIYGGISPYQQLLPPFSTISGRLSAESRAPCVSSTRIPRNSVPLQFYSNKLGTSLRSGCSKINGHFWLSSVFSFFKILTHFNLLVLSTFL